MSTISSTSETPIKLTCDAYTVGWLCVQNIEYDVARIFLDEEHEPPSRPRGDPNAYIVGRMGGHNVVILKFTQPGTVTAATAATHMLRSFEKIRFGLIVGTASGATDCPESHDPRRSTTDILLGDVVVNRPKGGHGGVLHCDLGRKEPEGFTIQSHLNSPGTLLVSAVDKLSLDHRHRPGNMARYIEEAQFKLQAVGMKHFHFPGRDHDLLFSSEYHHPDRAEKDCQSCDRAHVLARTSIPREGPAVHHGLIASGNTLLRDPSTRDNMRREHGAICFEMEAAGLMNILPCLAIRGISDYADTHKIDVWEPYAALTAAAYARDLLALIQPQVTSGVDMVSNDMSVVRLRGGSGEVRTLEYSLGGNADTFEDHASQTRVMQ